MLKRKIEQRLIEWKNTPNKKPLIIKGCRQCGKTFSVLDFAKKNYKNVVYLNFFENPDYASVFSGSLEIDNIIAAMARQISTGINISIFSASLCQKVFYYSRESVEGHCYDRCRNESYGKSADRFCLRCLGYS